jgi:hypothetical protein
MEPSQSDPLVRSIKRLTLAVWALVVLVGINVAFYFSAYLPFFNSSVPVATSEMRGSVPPPEVVREFKQLHGLPPEEMVKHSSVITISMHEVDGSRGKCVLREVLKHSPGVRFYYKVGDEFRHCSFDPKEERSYGEGQVTFFVGNPAEMRYATTFFGERISGLGDMPIGELRAIIASEQKAAK